ncbi:transmembrane protein, putative [Medicago truncatula]|uniref:Transmembrane protein, putative n=1 Tax=Medicago truncatula TaxID=3880 RepID=G7IS02_MEDTR|nr:transmembrane protein, putative [Medicago truncatula]
MSMLHRSSFTQRFLSLCRDNMNGQRTMSHFVGLLIIVFFSHLLLLRMCKRKQTLSSSSYKDVREQTNLPLLPPLSFSTTNIEWVCFAASRKGSFIFHFDTFKVLQHAFESVET